VSQDMAPAAASVPFKTLAQMELFREDTASEAPGWSECQKLPQQQWGAKLQWLCCRGTYEREFY